MKKNVVAILMAYFSLLSVNSQEKLNLVMKLDSQRPTRETNHFYLMEIKNNTNTSLNFKISVSNASCQNIDINEQTSLDHFVLDSNKEPITNIFNLEKGESEEFYVKISRSKKTKENTWNCTNIKAVSSTTVETLSNTLLIKSLIPDPKKFN